MWIGALVCIGGGRWAGCEWVLFHFESDFFIIDCISLKNYIIKKSDSK